MPRRFPKENHVALEDYSAEELSLIAATRAVTHFDLDFGPGLRAQLATCIDERHANRIPQENAALAVNLLEQAVDRMAERLMGEASEQGYHGEQGTTLTAADFQIERDSVVSSQEKRQTVEAELANLTGMPELKKMLSDVRKQALYVVEGVIPRPWRGRSTWCSQGTPAQGKALQPG